MFLHFHRGRKRGKREIVKPRFRPAAQDADVRRGAADGGGNLRRGERTGRCADVRRGPVKIYAQNYLQAPAE